MTVGIADIRRAADAIADTVIVTPTVRSRTLSDMTGTRVYLKLENLQYTGSFKERGAVNRLLQLSADERAAGVIAMSAGNHAQAVAHNAARFGIHATIVMPEATPFMKISNTEALGAEVMLHGADLAEAAVFAREEADRRGLTFVHPYDDPAIIAGQGTLVPEMLEIVPDLDTLIIPVGGGGLIAGCITAAKALNPEIEIVGVQAARCPAMLAAIRGVELESHFDTLAEGIAVKRPGALTRPIIEANETDIILVEEGDIEQAIMLLAEIEKLVVEGAGAAGLAALIANPDRFADRRVGIVISGGNIDARLLAGVLMRGLLRAERLIRLRVEIFDRPGQLAGLSQQIGALGGNIVEVEHQRWFHDVPARRTLIEMLIEVRVHEDTEAIVRALEGDGHRVTRMASTAASEIS